ncbi:MAG: DUF4838 domain-containing protein [Lentisphaeria bacterium]|nr:DUF4838 domain-containing protein [Lentisphaeria bacterium]
MKKLFVCAMLLCSMAVFAAEFVFADKGKTDFTIVLPEKTVGFEDMAAKDLQSFFKQMSGAELKIVKESAAPAKNAIYVGNTDFAKKAGINVDKLTAETWVIKPVNSNLILSGGFPIGSFYAVWQILNRFGCYALNMEQNAVPKLDKLALNISAEQKKPAFDGRLIWDNYPGYFITTRVDESVKEAYRMYKLRNGFNGRQRKDDSHWLYSGHNISHIPQFHSLSFYVHPKLYDKHPEYFAMDPHGKRVRPRSFSMEGCLCMSNPDVKRISLESLRNMIKKDRQTMPREKWPIVYDISTLDNFPYICYCPNCKKISDYEGSQTGILLQYINHIATEIKKEYPEIIIRTFGYSASATPPKKIFPADNVLIQLTDKFTESDPFKPLTHPINAQGRIPHFKAWRKGAKRLMVWDYWNIAGSYYKPPRPDSVINAVQPDLKFFRDMNVTDLFMESSVCPWAPQSFIDLTFFVAGQLMINPDQDQERLIDIYFNSYYGPAAKDMKELFNAIRKGMMDQKNRQTSAIVSHWSYMTPAFVYKTYTKLTELAAKLPQPYKQRINSEKIVFIWYALAKRDSYGKIFKQNGIDINNFVGEVRSLVKAHIRRFKNKTPERMDKLFEDTFKSITLNIPRPEKFKHVPDENFRMIAYPNFRGVSHLGSKVVNDPESITGKALKSAHKDPMYHGVNKRLPGKYNFYTTHFKWGNHKASGAVELYLTQVPQDEKYHWFRMPGKFEMKPLSYFWGQGWAIQASTSHLYTLTDGNPLDNTWDQVWVSAKFTGPAYVPGSTKENAIYVDMAVLVRNEKDMSFVPVKESMFPAAPAAGFPNGWAVDRKNVIIEHKDGKTSAVVTEKDTVNRIVGPFCPAAFNDVLTLQLRTSIDKCRVGFFFYDKNKKYLGAKFYSTQSGRKHDFMCSLNTLKFGKNNPENIAFFRVLVLSPKKGIRYTVDELEVKKAENFNVYK